MDIDSIYLVFNDGSIYTNIDADLCRFTAQALEFDGIIGVEEFDYDELYAIGRVREEDCVVLWRNTSQEDLIKRWFGEWDEKVGDA